MSVGSDYSVTPEDVQTAAANCASTAAQLDTELTALKSYVMDLEAQWQGIASQTFSALMADYTLYSQMLENALIDIGQGLTGNYVNYSDAEQTNISSLQTVHGDLPGANFA